MITRSTSASVSEVIALRSAALDAEGCAMRNLSVGAKRSISAAQFASSEAGATSRLGARVGVAVRCGVDSCLRIRSSDSTWMVLPNPMSSARQAPSPRRCSR